MEKLSDYPNIGKEIEKQLHEVGITSMEQLRQVGSRQAWLDIQKIDPSACYNRLCGLEGAVQNIRWHYLNEDIKKDLKEFYNKNKIN